MTAIVPVLGTVGLLSRSFTLRRHRPLHFESCWFSRNLPPVGRIRESAVAVTRLKTRDGLCTAAPTMTAHCATGLYTLPLLFGGATGALLCILSLAAFSRICPTVGQIRESAVTVGQIRESAVAVTRLADERWTLHSGADDDEHSNKSKKPMSNITD